MKLVWPLASNMYYKEVEFEFTEKDRLYLLRFVLNDEHEMEPDFSEKAILRQV